MFKKFRWPFFWWFNMEVFSWEKSSSLRGRRHSKSCFTENFHEKRRWDSIFLEFFYIKEATLELSLRIAFRAAPSKRPFRGYPVHSIHWESCHWIRLHSVRMFERVWAWRKFEKVKNLWILNLNEQPFSVIIDVETLRDVDGGTRRPFGAMSKSDVYMVKFEEIKMFSFAWIILKNCSIFCSKNSIRFFTSQTLFWQCHSLPASAYYTGEWEWLQRVAGKCLQTLW